MFVTLSVLKKDRDSGNNYFTLYPKDERRFDGVGYKTNPIGPLSVQSSVECRETAAVLDWNPPTKAPQVSGAASLDGVYFGTFVS